MSELSSPFVAVNWTIAGGAVVLVIIEKAPLSLILFSLIRLFLQMAFIVGTAISFSLWSRQSKNIELRQESLRPKAV